MKRIVLSLGGSVLVPSLESNNIAKYAKILQEIAQSYQLFVVIGGGGEARRYIRAARDLGIDEATADDLGIMVTRLNATMLRGVLGQAAYPVIAESYVQARAFGESGRIVIMGGMTPAQTTDAVSAVLAEYVGADVLINATSVEGIFSADPKTVPDAVRYDTLSPEELITIIIQSGLNAGSNTVVDLVAAKIVQRSAIPLVVLDGRDPENIRNALFSGTFVGTIVSNTGENPLPL
jgi:uridylate kinase